MKKFYIADSTFYITHSCNLTCHNCETYNNRKFKGHYTWEKYKKDYEKWSMIVDLGIVNIHGGEPFSHPGLLDWARELKQLWPNADDYTVSTNGTLIKNKQKLAKDIIDLGWRLDVSVHDPITFEEITQSIIDLFDNKKVRLEKQEKTGEHIISDLSTNKVIATVLPQYYFLKNSTKYIKQGKIFMHRSNIRNAHKLCQEYDNMPPCRWFVAGKLFKCHLTAISKDLINQFTIEEEAVKLLEKYTPASPYDELQSLNEFFKMLDKPLEQCTLCPENNRTFPIYPLSKKKQ